MNYALDDAAPELCRAADVDRNDRITVDELVRAVSRALNGNSTLVGLARADGSTRALIVPSSSRHAPFSGEPAFARLRDEQSAA